MRGRTFVPWVLAMVSTVLCSAQGRGQPRAIDTQNSKLLVHVSKAGLLSALGDDHEVQAPISEGFVDEGARQVRFVIESQRMKALEPHLSPEKRQQVQERMLSPEVLDVARFPQIKFESTSVEQAGAGRLVVRGLLFLHGVTRPITVNVHTENGYYIGNATLKQRDFGITPVSIAGGTVRVKDELKIEFDIRMSAQAAGVTLR